MIIGDIFKYFPQDIKTVLKMYQTVPSCDQKERDHKVNRAFMRIVTTFGMGFCVVTGVTKLATASIIIGASTAVVSAFIFLVCYDFFKTAQAVEEKKTYDMQDSYVLKYLNPWPN